MPKEPAVKSQPEAEPEKKENLPKLRQKRAHWQQVLKNLNGQDSDYVKRVKGYEQADPAFAAARQAMRSAARAHRQDRTNKALYAAFRDADNLYREVLFAAFEGDVAFRQAYIQHRKVYKQRMEVTRRLRRIKERISAAVRLRRERKVQAAQDAG